jgi:dual specificity phosphatase 12
MWEIARGLYLGDRKDAHDRELLVGLGITHIVNCAAEIPCWHRQDFRYLRLKLTDPDPEFHESIEKFCKFIHRGRKQGNVLVHCAAGVSRSPSVILAYLCSRGKDLDSALDRLQRRVGEAGNSFILPDASFLEQIEIYFEDQRRGE